MIPIAADLPQMHLTFACREGGGGGGGEDDLGKVKAAQRRGAQLVNTLADASRKEPSLKTIKNTVNICANIYDISRILLKIS